MKYYKHIIQLMIAAIIMMACSSESYPGLMYEDVDVVNNNETPDDSKALPIHVYVNEQSVVSLSPGAAARQDEVTRGIGPFQIYQDADWNELSEEETKLAKTKRDSTYFYIFAFRNKTAEQSSPDTKQLLNDPDMHTNCQIKQSNRPGDAHDDPMRLDCLIDGYDYYKGMPSRLDESLQGLNLDVPKTSPLYWGEYQEVSYNFFAYSVGDVRDRKTKSLLSSGDNTDAIEGIQWGIPHRDRDSVWFENFAIDGSQDLMVGYAPIITTDLFADDGRYAEMRPSTDETRKYALTEGEYKRILNDGRYTSFAAHRGIEPQVDMKHVLTRLRFKMRPGDETASNTTIDAIYATTPYKGKFIVANKDKVNDDGTIEVGFVGFRPDMSDDAKGDLLLRDYPEIAEDGSLLPAKLISELPEEDRIVPWKDEYWIREDGKIVGKIPLNERGDPLRIGDNLLIPEAEKITISIESTFKRKDDEGNVVEERKFRSRYTIKAELQAGSPGTETYSKYYDEATGRFLFKRGHIYDITLVVYGLQPIQVSANIDGWQQGGDIPITPDDAEDAEAY